MKYSLGLDIGITSVGWAVLNLDDRRVEDLGVRAFNAAENPKDKSSLAEPRRLARSARRRLRRRAGRLQRAKDLFITYKFIAPEHITQAFETSSGKKSPWELRAEGLDRLLSGEEFARALFHIVKRRGFKSNRKKVINKDDGKMLKGISGNRQIMSEHKYLTAGHMYWADKKFEFRKRNTTDSYLNTVDRELLEDEVRLLFKCQREKGSNFAKEEVEQALLDIFHWQKPFASGDDIIKLVGYCTFEDGEIRAPKNSYHAERFNLLQKINNTSYSVNGDIFRFNDEQRAKIAEMAYKTAKVTYAQIRKELQLGDEIQFNGLKNKKRNKKDQEPDDPKEQETSTFIELKGYHALQKAFSGDGLWEKVKHNPNLMDDIVYATTFYKTDADIADHLGNLGVDQSIIEASLNCEFTKTHNLSLVAIKKILPHLEKGLQYWEACAAAGYNHCGVINDAKSMKLPVIPTDMIRNPVVLRALTQSRKVVNAVIDRYGSPYRIHIELARDMGKSADKRKEIEKEQRENENERKELEAQFKESFGFEPNGTALLKWRLYREQDGHCAYSLKNIDLNRLFENGYAEIDHILPYSRSFDDSRANKVLALTAENQNKRNRTPYEWFGHEVRWGDYEAWVKAIIHNPKKRARMLKTSFDQRQEAEWKERNLVDTRYIVREFTSFIKENLLFANADGNPLVCVNGQVVARARWLWGLDKNRDENDLHHAQDAAVIAALLPHQVKLLTEHAKVTETRDSYTDLETGESIDYGKDDRPRLPYPWPGFRKEVLTKLENVLVSRMPQRKASGAIHAETIRSAKCIDTKGISAVKKPLTSLSKDDMNKLYDPEHNEKLYEAIRQRMAEHGDDAKKAFTEPLYKPLKDGGDGPQVKSVKVCQTQNTGVSVRGGIADNGDMVRTDVFRKQNKKGIWQYYLVPIYVSDMMAGRLPERAIAANTPEDQWPMIDQSYEFLFSLYPYELIRMKTEKLDSLLYYRGCHRGKGALTISEINENSDTRDIGARTAEVIEKYQMGVLGDYYPVRKEARCGLANDGNLEPCEAED